MTTQSPFSDMTATNLVRNGSSNPTTRSFMSIPRLMSNFTVSSIPFSRSFFRFQTDTIRNWVVTSFR
jgi:hypothetical protein